MEENKKDIENESNEISEQSLEEVAGGTDQEATDCNFLPKYPYEAKKSHGAVWVKCSSGACRTCRCFGNIYCEGMMHMMERDRDDPLVWRPMRAGYIYHMGNEKIVVPLDMG